MPGNRRANLGTSPTNDSPKWIICCKATVCASIYTSLYDAAAAPLWQASIKGQIPLMAALPPPHMGMILKMICAVFAGFACAC
jgi:hypothetical protein